MLAPHRLQQTVVLENALFRKATFRISECGLVYKTKYMRVRRPDAGREWGGSLHNATRFSALTPPFSCCRNSRRCFSPFTAYICSSSQLCISNFLLAAVDIDQVLASLDTVDRRWCTMYASESSKAQGISPHRLHTYYSEPNYILFR